MVIIAAGAAAFGAYLLSPHGFEEIEIRNRTIANNLGDYRPKYEKYISEERAERDHQRNLAFIGAAIAAGLGFMLILVAPQRNSLPLED